MGRDLSAVGIFIIGLVFTAGGVYWMFLRTLRDLDGLARRQRDFEAKTDRRHARTGLAIIEGAPEEKKDKVANILLGNDW